MDLLPIGIAAEERGIEIAVLKPNVGREDAVILLRRAGLRKWSWIRRASPLRSVAEFYVPFQIFRANIKHRASSEERIIAIDLISGMLDPFTFHSLPSQSDVTTVHSRNCPQPFLSSKEAEQALRTKLQRLLFQFGFFRVGGLEIGFEPIKRLYMPYWLGFFGAGDMATIEVLDAVRRAREGAKFRRIVQDWIVKPASPSCGESFTKTFL